jgi:hypothetical protein
LVRVQVDHGVRDCAYGRAYGRACAYGRAYAYGRARAYTSEVISTRGGSGTRKARVHATDGAGQGGTRVHDASPGCVAHARLVLGARNAVAAIVGIGENGGNRGNAATHYCDHE